MPLKGPYIKGLDPIYHMNIKIEGFRHEKLGNVRVQRMRGQDLQVTFQNDEKPWLYPHKVDFPEEERGERVSVVNVSVCVCFVLWIGDSKKKPRSWRWKRRRNELLTTDVDVTPSLMTIFSSMRYLLQESAITRRKRVIFDLEIFGHLLFLKLIMYSQNLSGR